MLAVGVNISASTIEVGIVTAKLGCLVKRKFSTKEYTAIKHYLERIIIEIEILLDHFPDHPVAGIGVSIPKKDSGWNNQLIENFQVLQAIKIVELLHNYFYIKVELISAVNARDLGKRKFRNDCDLEILGAASQFLTVMPRL